MKPINKGLRYLCKELYFKHRTIDEIIRTTEVKQGTLSKWIHGRFKGDPKAWKLIRESEFSLVIEEQYSIRAVKVARIGSLTIDIVQHCINQRLKLLDADGIIKPLPWDELKALTEISLNTEKLMRLQAGKPTDIKEVNSNIAVSQPPIPTMIELQHTIMSDPFMRKLFPKEGKTDDREQLISDPKRAEEIQSTGIQGLPSRGPQAARDLRGDGFDPSFESDDSND